MVGIDCANEECTNPLCDCDPCAVYKARPLCLLYNVEWRINSAK